MGGFKERDVLFPESVQRSPDGVWQAWDMNRLYTDTPDFTAPEWTLVPRGRSQLHVSQGNPHHLLGKAPGALGGDFRVSHFETLSTECSPWAQIDGSPGPTRKRFVGNFWASDGAPGGFNIVPTQPEPTSTDWALVSYNHPAPIFTSKSELEEWGTTAIAIVEPTNPLSGLTVALAELKREGLPSVPGIQSWKDKSSLAKSAGGEYLNKEFGWDPLLSDIRKTISVTRNAEKLIAQYERGSGRKIHRSFQPPKETTVETTTSTSGNHWRYLYPQFFTDRDGNVDSLQSLFASAPSWTRTLTTEKTRWFEGCFTYYLPAYKIGGSNLERNRRLAYKLYGVGITPEIVWDLTPWSWAIDWVSNAGDVFHNIGAFADNGLVMHYGYVMEEIVQTATVTTTGINPLVNWQGTDLSRPLTSVYRTTTKQRITATPYGFGLNWDGFSSFQWSILGALGLSRRR